MLAVMGEPLRQGKQRKHGMTSCKHCDVCAWLPKQAFALKVRELISTANALVCSCLLAALVRWSVSGTQGRERPDTSNNVCCTFPLPRLLSLLNDQKLELARILRVVNTLQNSRARRWLSGDRYLGELYEACQACSPQACTALATA